MNSISNNKKAQMNTNTKTNTKTNNLDKKTKISKNNKNKNKMLNNSLDSSGAWQRDKLGPFQRTKSGDKNRLPPSDKQTRNRENRLDWKKGHSMKKINPITTLARQITNSDKSFQTFLDVNPDIKAKYDKSVIFQETPRQDFIAHYKEIQELDKLVKTHREVKTGVSHDAVVAKARTLHMRPISTLTHSDGSVLVVGTEFTNFNCLASSSTAGLNEDYYITPLSSSLFPKASRIAEIYDFATFETLTAHYVPGTATSSDGYVDVYFEPDPADPDPLNLQQTVSYSDEKLFAPWQTEGRDASMHQRFDLHNSPYKTVAISQDVPTDTAEIRQWACGKIGILTANQTSPSSGVGMGKVLITYCIRFRKQHLPVGDTLTQTTAYSHSGNVASGLDVTTYLGPGGGFMSNPYGITCSGRTVSFPTGLHLDLVAMIVCRGNGGTGPLWNIAGYSTTLDVTQVSWFEQNELGVNGVALESGIGSATTGVPFDSAVIMTAFNVRSRGGDLTFPSMVSIPSTWAKVTMMIFHRHSNEAIQHRALPLANNLVCADDHSRVWKPHLLSGYSEDCSNGNTLDPVYNFRELSSETNPLYNTTTTLSKCWFRLSEIYDNRKYQFATRKETQDNPAQLAFNTIEELLNRLSDINTSGMVESKSNSSYLTYINKKKLELQTFMEYSEFMPLTPSFTKCFEELDNIVDDLTKLYPNDNKMRHLDFGFHPIPDIEDWERTSDTTCEGPGAMVSLSTSEYFDFQRLRKTNP